MYPVTIIQDLRIGKTVDFFGRPSAIEKQSIPCSTVSALGIEGDEQAEALFHGGVDRALLQCAPAHYARLQAEFPDSTDYFQLGAFGENIIAEGFDETTLCIGDKVQAGSLLLEVSLPRQPCFKLNQRFQEPTLSRYVNDHCIAGWFYRVLQEGELAVGDTMKVIERPYPQWTVAKVQHYLNVEPFNEAAMTELVNLAPLGEQVKKVFRRRLETGVVEESENRLLGRQAS